MQTVNNYAIMHKVAQAYWPSTKCTLKQHWGTSLVAQWLRIHLPMQGTRVWSLVREDPTCRRATKPVCHNYWACALEPASHNYWAHGQQLLKPTRLEPMLRNKRSPCSLQLEKACAQQRRPKAAKKKYIKKKSHNEMPFTSSAGRNFRWEIKGTPYVAGRSNNCCAIGGKKYGKSY